MCQADRVSLRRQLASALPALPTWKDLGGRPSTVRRALNVWPPFLFSGIVVEEIGQDFRAAQVSLRPRPFTRNYVGTLFGGSLFAMTDPFWMVMIARNLGDDYVVWDKAGEIDFVSPGRARVTARFELTDETIEELRAAAADHSKVLRWFETEVMTAEGVLVARVRKQIYVRRRRDLPPVPTTSAPQEATDERVQQRR